jgi:hypothetical protein
MDEADVPRISCVDDPPTLAALSAPLPPSTCPLVCGRPDPQDIEDAYHSQRICARSAPLASMLLGRAHPPPTWGSLRNEPSRAIARRLESEHRRDEVRIVTLARRGEEAMACCKGSASWFCCYPDPCGCDGGCCQGSCCSCGCSSSNKMGVGACCTCNTNNAGFAWRTTAYSCGRPCQITYNCGARVYFNHTADCIVWVPGTRVDSGPACNTGRMVDFTKSLFMNFAPLSAGVISNVKADPNFGCC